MTCEIHNLINKVKNTIDITPRGPINLFKPGCIYHGNYLQSTQCRNSRLEVDEKDFIKNKNVIFYYKNRFVTIFVVKPSGVGNQVSFEKCKIIVEGDMRCKWLVNSDLKCLI